MLYNNCTTTDNTVSTDDTVRYYIKIKEVIAMKEKIKGFLAVLLTLSILGFESQSVLAAVHREYIDGTMGYVVKYIAETENEKWNDDNLTMLLFAKDNTDKNEPVISYRYFVTPSKQADFVDTKNTSYYDYTYKKNGEVKEAFIVERTSKKDYPMSFTYLNGNFTKTNQEIAKKYIDKLLASKQDYVLDNEFDPIISKEKTNEGYSFVIGRELDELLDFVMKGRKVNLLLSQLTVNKDNSVVFDKSTEMITGIRYSNYKEPLKEYFRKPAKSVWYQVEGYTKNREKIILSGGLEVDYKVVKDIYKYYKKQASVERLYYKTFRYKGKEVKARVLYNISTIAGGDTDIRMRSQDLADLLELLGEERLHYRNDALSYKHGRYVINATYILKIASETNETIDLKGLKEWVLNKKY